MSDKPHDDLFDIIESNEVDVIGKEDASSVTDPSFKGDPLSPTKGLLGKAIEAIEAAETEEEEIYNLEQLLSPKTKETSTKKLRSARYETKVYVLILKNEEETSDNIKYEEIVNAGLSGKHLLVREEWYDLKGRDSVKVVIKVLIPKQKKKDKKDVR